MLGGIRVINKVYELKHKRLSLQQCGPEKWVILLNVVLQPPSHLTLSQILLNGKT